LSCGNTAAAVALYAVEERLVEPVDGLTRVRIHCRNNDKRITAVVATGAAEGTRVRLEFHDPGGGDTGSLLPSGEAINEIRTARGTRVRFSLIDCGNLYAVIPASTWSLTGSESPTELDGAADVLREIEELRQAIPARFLPPSIQHASRGNLASRLKIAIIGRPLPDPGRSTDSNTEQAVDVVARIVNPERVHKAFAVTGAMNLAAAAALPGSIVTELANRRLSAGRDTFRIRHPQGVIAPEVVFDGGSGPPNLRSIGIDRTARRIMNGYVYVPERSLCA
jgi:2-methylaconitate cis-trans-isomerase PrpF